LGCREAAQVDLVSDRNASDVQSLSGKKTDQAPVCAVISYHGTLLVIANFLIPA
jgi:hypothetical protein